MGVGRVVGVISVGEGINDGVDPGVGVLIVWIGEGVFVRTTVSKPIIGIGIIEVGERVAVFETITICSRGIPGSVSVEENNAGDARQASSRKKRKMANKKLKRLAFRIIHSR